MTSAIANLRFLTPAVLLIVLFHARSAPAVDFTWTGAGGPFRTFGDAANWKPTGGPPNDTNDVAIFDGTQSGSSSFTVNFAANVVNDRLVMTANFPGTVTLDLFDRTYTLDGTSAIDASLEVGESSDDRARMLLTSSATLGTVSAQHATVGGSGEGTLTVSSKARLLLADSLFVGSSNTGELNIVDGGLVDSSYLGAASIGLGFGVTGTVTVSGAGSLWRNKGHIRVGSNGNAFLIVEDGGRVEATSANVGSRDFPFPDATGAATVTGANSVWVNSSRLDVGPAVNGTLTISAGGIVASDSGTVGNESTGNGTVLVTGAGSVWDNATALMVGVSGIGAMTISQGGAVENTSAQIGSNIGSTGTVSVSGTGSSWTGVDSVYVGGSDVASGGSGTLNVGGSSTVNVGTTTTEVLKVWETGRVNLNGGTINTQDFDLAGIFDWTTGTLNAASDVTVRAGASGTGLTIGPGKTLSVGAKAEIQPGGALRLDGGTFSSGSLVNNGSLLLNSGTFNLSSGFSLGPGSPFGNQLTIGPGLSFNVTGVGAAPTIGAGAVLAMRGGTFSSTDPLTNNGEIQLTDEFTTVSGGNLFNNGLVLGRGRINKGLVNSATGVVRTTGDQRLVFGGASNANSGRLELVGGTMEFASALTNSPTGLISGRGALFFNGSLTNQGKMQFSGGSTDIYGNVAFTGAAGGGELINSGGGNVVTFYGNVTHNGDEIRTSPTNTTVFFGNVTGAGPFTGTGAVRFEGSFAPGNSPGIVHVEGDVQMGPASRLALELAGTQAGDHYDQLTVGGLLALDGALDVSLLDGFTPHYGDRFDLIDFGSLVGRFNSMELPALNAGLIWDTTALYSTGSITAVPEPQSALLAVVAILVAYATSRWRLRTVCAKSTRLQEGAFPRCCRGGLQ